VTTIKVEDSERLSYRMMTPDDADFFFDLDDDPEVMRYITGGKTTSMADVHAIFIPRMQSYTNAEKGWGLWKVTVKTSDEFIGWVLVRPMDYFSDAPQWNNIEIGWRYAAIKTVG
jgi:RimJ/RimL family protein N-acetyltransferase